MGLLHLKLLSVLVLLEVVKLLQHSPPPFFLPVSNLCFLQFLKLII